MTTCVQPRKNDGLYIIMCCTAWCDVQCRSKKNVDGHETPRPAHRVTRACVCVQRRATPKGCLSVCLSVCLPRTRRRAPKRPITLCHGCRYSQMISERVRADIKSPIIPHWVVRIFVRDWNEISIPVWIFGFFSSPVHGNILLYARRHSPAI